MADLSDAHDVYDLDGDQLSRDCLAVCAPGAPAACDADWCQCDCHTEPRCPCEIPGTGREGDCVGATCPIPPDGARRLMAALEAHHARERDNRPAEALRSIARDMEHERYGDVAGDRLPTLDELRAERFGWPTKGAA